MKGINYFIWVSYILSIGMCLYFYDWKLLVILFLFTMANNAEQYKNRLRESQAKSVVKSVTESENLEAKKFRQPRMGFQERLEEARRKVNEKQDDVNKNH